MTSKVNIGTIIKQTLKSEGISVSEFAQQIHCTERNVYKIFNKPSIDTNLLARINIALGKNLFSYYTSPEFSEDHSKRLVD